MARTPALLGADREANMDAMNLRRMLVRLEQQIMLAGPDSPLLHSSFERDKVAQNLEYARTLLLRIQHNDATGVKPSPAKKHAQQAELTRHRALVKRLTEKLYDMRRQDNDDEHRVVGLYVKGGGGGGPEQEDAGEDLLAKYFAPEEPSQPKSAHSRDGSASNGVSSTTATTTSDGVRSRNVAGGQQPSATSTGSAMATPTKGPTSTALASELFATSTKSPGFQSGVPPDLSTEKRLAHQDATQAELTSSLVSLAQQLKASSLAFADDLAADNEALTKTEGALGKNQDGLDAASKRMGVLRKMTEGRWWWQRYIMFILLAVAWVLEVAIVFLGPKLRF